MTDSKDRRSGEEQRKVNNDRRKGGDRRKDSKVEGNPIRRDEDWDKIDKGLKEKE